MKHKNLFLKFILALHSARALARHGGEYYEKKQKKARQKKREISQEPFCRNPAPYPDGGRGIIYLEIYMEKPGATGERELSDRHGIKTDRRHTNRTGYGKPAVRPGKQVFGVRGGRAVGAENRSDSHPNDIR